MINLKRILAIILLSLLTNSSQMETHTEEKQLQRMAKFGNKKTSEAESNAILSKPLLPNYISLYNYYYSNDFGNDFILADTLDQNSFQNNIFEIKLINNTNQFYDYVFFHA